MRTLAVLALLAAAPVAAATLESGTPVTVLKVDGSHYQATFLGTASDPPRLRLVESKPRTWGEIGPRVVDIPLTDVAAVEGPAGFRLHEERLPTFVIGGAILGGILGYMIRTPSHGGVLVHSARIGPGTNATIAIDGGDGHVLEGVAIGAAAGAFFGLLASHGRGPVERWTFTEEGEIAPP